MVAYTWIPILWCYVTSSLCYMATQRWVTWHPSLSAMTWFSRDHTPSSSVCGCRTSGPISPGPGSFHITEESMLICSLRQVAGFTILVFRILLINIVQEEYVFTDDIYCLQGILIIYTRWMLASNDPNLLLFIFVIHKWHLFLYVVISMELVAIWVRRWTREQAFWWSIPSALGHM